MAEHHVQRFSAIDGVTIAAAVDGDSDRAAIFAGKAGIPSIYRDIEQLAVAGAADAIAISSRDIWHAGSAIEALSRGLPVFCEKPMARRLEEARAMMQAADASGLPTMVNFSKRNGGLLSLARDIIASGEIGRVESAEFFYLQDWLYSCRWGDWRTKPRWQWRLDESQSSHGVLGDLGSHCVDAMLYLFDEARPRACASRRFESSTSVAWRPKVGAEVAASALLDSPDCSETLSVSFGARSSGDAFGFRIRGGLGDIVADTDQSRDKLTILADDGSTSRKARPEEYPSTYERFVQLALGGIDPLAEDRLDFGWGLDVVRIIDSLAAIASSDVVGRAGGNVTATADNPGSADPNMPSRAP